ncbi:hypothetical protein KUTeg_013873, partial [Tegillarca granosa]
MAAEKEDSVNWKIESVISEQLEIEEWISRNVVHLLDQGNTIPFIARYRKEQTGGLEVDKIRDINESGVSIYSCTDVAKKDMPNLDPSLRGAVSIARRLLDPMAEFVKVEPKHLGVGQYQHDMPENQRIAGLNETRAKKIVEYRQTNGLFINRKQLRLIKGIGDKSFEQCAGF